MWAFSDESERAGLSLLAVVLVAPKDLDGARRGMRRLLMRGERSVHTANESPPRRKRLLDAVARIDGLEAVVFRYRRRPGVGRDSARSVLVEAATGLIIERSVASWTLDNVGPSERAQDRHIIGRTLARHDHGHQVVFDHRRYHEEPLLWAADAVCWATGARQDWKRRVEPILTTVDIGP